MRRDLKRVDIVIVGGGPAGLAAAVRLYERGVRSLLIVERERQLGGILRQCIHDGFGLTRFKTSLSGPEYAARFIRQVEELGIPYVTDTTVLEVSPDKVVTAVSRGGLVQWQAGAVILTMGCRERTRGALGIPGERPAGVFTAGVAQAYINLYNTMPAREVVILGSGDIGMIMARRLTLEGAHVQAVFEIQPYASGLPRNIEQCLNDYDIPLYLSHTVTEIHGNSRLTGVTVSQVDEHFQTSVDGIFAAGNVLHVHDLVDFVSMEAENLADSVAEYVRAGGLAPCPIRIHTDKYINHTVPQRVSGRAPFTLSLRVNRPLKDCRIVVRQNGTELAEKRMKKAIPAEMIQIAVDNGRMAQTGDLEVSVE